MGKNKDRKDDKFKAILDQGNKEYLLSLNAKQLDLIIHSKNCERLHKAIEKHGLRLIKILKIIEK